MQGTIITTPEGHQCRLMAYLRDNGTEVTVSHGDLSVSKSSQRQGDVDLIDQAVTAMDDLLTNLRDHSPHLEEIPWW